MGLPNDGMNWYHLVLAFIILGGHDGYIAARRNTLDTYDRVCDSINTTIHKLQTASRKFFQAIHFLRQPASIRFTDFPLEIRQLIWHYAANEPRVVELRRDTEAIILARRNDSVTQPCIYSIAQVPSVLQTCSESRIAGLKSYELAFGTHDQEPRIYVNFEHDVIFMGRKCMFPFCFDTEHSAPLLEKDVKRIKRLAIRNERSSGHAVQAWDRKKFKDVKEVIVVGQNSKERRFDLGPMPDLRIRGEKNAEDVEWKDVGSTTSDFKNFVMIRILEDRIGVHGEVFEDSGKSVRSDVLVRDGTFVKGLRDTWFSPRRSWVF
ncbi:hypothetical protein VTL71DRAFT_15849 [Oculimacula yallundae]|uniref:2EXR domain-containing protein n=1 Tax=Oculimacula yallundae TaxID=86028 RepID=A0ABR4CCS5_9HELO